MLMKINNILLSALRKPHFIPVNSGLNKQDRCRREAIAEINLYSGYEYT